MKKLSIEEKAKAYDEAIEKAKKVKDNPFAGYDGSDVISYLFPELQESENERIRKGLIGYFRAGKCENISSYHGISTNDILAWLEKQDEQKPAWSEEDKCMLNNVIDTLKPLSQTTHSGYAINSMINWLKSIRPQTTWKPSDEQIIELRHVISGCSYDIEPLVEIEEHLKKLREK